LKKKFFLINFSLFLIFTYLPLFFGNLYLGIFENDKKFFNARYKELKLDKKNISLKRKLVEIGYLPFYFPETIRSFSKDSNFYPIGTIPFAKTILCDEGYGLITYKSDRFGLRNNDKFWDKVKEGKNIFLIGDSYTHGICVKDEYTISSILNQKTDLNSLNLGSGGNGPYEYIAIINSIIKPIIRKNKNKPTWIVINYYVNDDIKQDSSLEDLIKDSKEILKFDSKNNPLPSSEYIEKITQIVSTNLPYSKKDIDIKYKQISAETNLFKNTIFYKLTTLTYLRAKIKFAFMKPKSKFFEKNTKLLKDPTEVSIKNLREICNSNCNPIITFIPNSNHWRTSKNLKSYKKKLSEIAKENKIDFIDGTQFIDSNNLSHFSPEGSHLSRESYENLAERIILKIKN